MTKGGVAVAPAPSPQFNVYLSGNRWSQVQRQHHCPDHAMSKAFKNFVFFFIVVLSLPSCVSKKRFLTEVSKRTACDSTLQQINQHNFALNREIANLKLQLAERKGENNILRELRDEQDGQINRLEAEIGKLTNQSLSQQEVLDGALQMRDRELAGKTAAIQRLKDAVRLQEVELSELIGKVADKLNTYPPESLSLEVQDGAGYIRLSEKLLFRPGTTKMTSSAYNILENIAHVILQYPQMDVLVVGHTDNQPVKTKNLKDNWDLSVLRATPVVRMLTKEFGLNPNQVIAGGKGDSKPRTSNDTSMGREQNRRTEIIIKPPADKILKMVVETY